MLTRLQLYKRWLMIRNNVDIDYGFEEFEQDYGDYLYHSRKEDDFEQSERRSVNQRRSDQRLYPGSL